MLQLKPIKGLKNYLISNQAQVINKNTGRILKQSTNSQGYKTVSLSENGKHKHCYVHRLVASAFLENKDKLPCVNHKDENPSNNNVHNLEWCTYYYNANYGTRNEKISRAKLNTNCKMVGQYLGDELVATYPSLHEVERLRGYKPSNISVCCTGAPRKTKYGKTYTLDHAYGYNWRYIEDENADYKQTS